MVKFLYFKLILIWKMVHAKTDVTMITPYENLNSAEEIDLKKCLSINFNLDVEIEILQRCVALFKRFENSDDFNEKKNLNRRIITSSQESPNDIGLLQGSNAGASEMREILLKLEKYTTSKYSLVEDTSIKSKVKITKYINYTNAENTPLMFTGIPGIPKNHTKTGKGKRYFNSLLNTNSSTASDLVRQHRVLKVAITKSLTTAPVTKITRTTTQIINSLQYDVNMITAMLESVNYKSTPRTVMSTLASSGTKNVIIEKKPKARGLNLVFVRTHTIPELNTQNNYLQYAAKKLEQMERKSFMSNNFRRNLITTCDSSKDERRMLITTQNPALNIGKHQHSKTQEWVKRMPKKHMATQPIGYTSKTPLENNNVTKINNKVTTPSKFSTGMSLKMVKTTTNTQKSTTTLSVFNTKYAKHILNTNVSTIVPLTKSEISTEHPEEVTSGGGETTDSSKTNSVNKQSPVMLYKGFKTNPSYHKLKKDLQNHKIRDTTYMYNNSTNQ